MAMSRINCDKELSSVGLFDVQNVDAGGVSTRDASGSGNVTFEYSWHGPTAVSGVWSVVATSDITPTLSGLALILVGAVVVSEFGDYSHFLENKVLAPPIVLIVAGAIVFIIAFLGCCGAIKENYYMLIAYAVLLMVIFVIELSVGIAASVARDQFSNAMRNSLQRSMGNYTRSLTDQIAWDTMQKRLKCCGMEGPQSWSEVIANNNVPGSCCVGNTQDDPSTVCRYSRDESQVYQKGCYDTIKMRTKDNIGLIMGFGIGIAFIELLGVVLACCLAQAVKKDEEIK